MKIYELETRNSGEDDVLLGDSLEDVRMDVEAGMETDMETEGWELRELSLTEYMETWEGLQHRSHTHEYIMLQFLEVQP